MRTLGIGSQRYTKVVCLDKPGAGNACHRYQVGEVDKPSDKDTPPTTFAWVEFQNGPIKGGDVNGCHNEDLIAIVIDRLQGFQSGDYSCRENALALTKLEEAMHWLNHRTAARQARGVEGTHTV